LEAPSLDFDGLAELKGIDLVMKETLRLYPSVPGIPRRTARACEIAGVEAPAGTMVWLISPFLHRLPEYWTRPDDFDPDRFSDERAEHKRHPFLYIPFGGDMHTCLGMQLSILQARSILHPLLLRYRLHLPPGYQMRMKIFPFARPVDDLPVRLERIS